MLVSIENLKKLKAKISYILENYFQKFCPDKYITQKRVMKLMMIFYQH